MASGFLTPQPASGFQLVERSEIAATARKRRARAVVVGRPPLVLVPSACSLVPSIWIKSQEQANHPGKIVLLVNRAIYVHAIFSILQLRLTCSRLSVAKRSEIAASARKRRAKTGAAGSPLLILVCLNPVCPYIPTHWEPGTGSSHRQKCGFLLKYCRSSLATENLGRRTATILLNSFLVLPSSTPCKQNKLSSHHSFNFASLTHEFTSWRHLASTHRLTESLKYLSKLSTFLMLYAVIVW